MVRGIRSREGITTKLQAVEVEDAVTKERPSTIEERSSGSETLIAFTGGEISNISSEAELCSHSDKLFDYVLTI